MIEAQNRTFSPIPMHCVIPDRRDVSRGRHRARCGKRDVMNAHAAIVRKPMACIARQPQHCP
jgi:hypothetical protein